MVSTGTCGPVLPFVAAVATGGAVVDSLSGFRCLSRTITETTNTMPTASTPAAAVTGIHHLGSPFFFLG